MSSVGDRLALCEFDGGVKGIKEWKVKVGVCLKPHERGSRGLCRHI